MSSRPRTLGVACDPYANIERRITDLRDWVGGTQNRLIETPAELADHPTVLRARERMILAIKEIRRLEKIADVLNPTFFLGKYRRQRYSHIKHRGGQKAGYDDPY